MPPRLRTTALALGLALALPAQALAGPLAKALDHLSARQDPVAGGFGEEPGSDPTYTAWAALAVAAAGEDPARWRNGLASLRDAVAAPQRLPKLADLELTAVAAAASGLDPRSVGGRNAVREVIAAQRADGSIGDSPATTAWGILALRAGGLDPATRTVRRARAALIRRQNPDGGWSIGPESPRLGPQHDLRGGAGPLGRRRPSGHDPGAGPGARLLRRRPERGRGVPGRPRRRHPGADDRLGHRRPPHAGGGPRAPAVEPVGRPARGAEGPAARQRRRAQRAQLAHRVGLGHLPDGAGAGARPPPAGPPGAPARAGRACRGALARCPAPGEPTRGPLVVRYQDDEGGTGIDPARVRLRVGGRDVTRRAQVTSFALRLPAPDVTPGAVVRLALQDRAGNASAVGWRLAGRGR